MIYMCTPITSVFWSLLTPTSVHILYLQDPSTLILFPTPGLPAAAVYVITQIDFVFLSQSWFDVSDEMEDCMKCTSLLTAMYYPESYVLRLMSLVWDVGVSVVSS